MKLTSYLRKPALLLVVFTLLGIFSERYVMTGGIRQQDIKRFSRTLHEKEKQLDELMNGAAKRLDTLQSDRLEKRFETLKSYNELFEHKELSLLITQNDELVYWSDHVVAFKNEITLAGEGFVQLPNGWYVLKKLRQNELMVYGLILIKYNYKIENDYLQNTFAKGFHLPDDFEVHFYKTESSYPIYSKSNSFLFSIAPSGLLPCIYSDLYVPAAFYLLALFLLFTLIYRINTHYFHRYARLKLLILLLALLGFYSLINQFNLPRSVYLLRLFSPDHFAYSSYWGSLGEFLLFSLFLFFWAINFSRTFDLPEKIKNKQSLRSIVLAAWLIKLALVFVFIRYMIYTLLLNSSISFALYRIEEISIYSFLGFLSIGLLFLTFFFLAYRITRIFRKNTSQREMLLMVTVLMLVFTLLTILIRPPESIRLSWFYWIIVLTGFFINKRQVVNHQLSLIVLFSLIFTFFSLINLLRFVEQRENKVQELMVVNLSAEHDPTAEVFLRDIDHQLKSDTLIQNYLTPPYLELESYLFRRYFGGYFREYDLQFTICAPADSVVIQPENIMQPCYPFFDHLIEEHGMSIPGISFSFVDNMNGRITYFGAYRFGEASKEVTLYIELNSKFTSEGIGFPELLLPSNTFENRLRGSFSFAKYNKGELVDRGGDFLYALTPMAYPLPAEELSFASWDGYQHCIYQTGEDSYIIVSRPEQGFYDYLISFPYIFVFLFLLALLVSFASRPYLNLTAYSGSLRMRIQAAIIGVVFVALLLVGSGTILYNIAQYRANHRNDLIDKINSVSVEMDMIMGEIERFDEQLIDYLSYDLVRISDVFWTDINVYDTNGALIATSRPEVFEKGLISTQMDNTAIFQLNKNQPTRFLHKEHIAEMEYLSAYVPFINRSGKNIGYINLPYFTKEREFRQEITTFILAFINIYVFLLLASILVAYFISTRITDPLKLIRENLRGIQLGKTTRRIEYNSEDEIGLLVAEYNSKVEELALSAELLARSERETAWREMAKQIAHEIKNPLTPMKLNIQFLQRSNPSLTDDYQEKLKKVTDTLIEQIDNLSAIATEFSNFAKIPKARNESFELTSRLREIIKLYNYTGQVEMLTPFERHNTLMVYADKEQFSRAILNLIKNAIQAIPENQEGKISIDIEVQKQNATISISDNGKGIPPDVQENIFVPNFTTKTSGAGLGLAITKNIVENFNGSIWFKTQVGKGSTFYIMIPLIKK
jgi:signal transduction histidine kinase